MTAIRISVVSGLAMLVAGCFSGAQVVSSNQGPTVSQAQAAPYDGPKQRIAVAGFETRSAKASREIGSGMTDMLMDSLFNSNRFIVLERDRLSDVTAEQDLQRGERFRQDTAAPAGQLEGAQLLVRGAITEFEPDCKGGSAILVSGKQACIGLNLRIVDVATGRVVNATTVQATSADNRVGLVFAVGSMPFGLGSYSNTPMERAIRNAIETAVHHIAQTKF